MKKRWIWTWIILFSLALVSSIDLLNNYLQALLPQDGITCTSVVYRLRYVMAAAGGCGRAANIIN